MIAPMSLEFTPTPRLYQPFGILFFSKILVLFDECDFIINDE